MQKKSVIIAVCLLAITLLTVACNKKDKKDPDSVSASVEYTTNEDGEKYITNVYGDLIPVTTSKDGSMELLEDLMTKTAEQVKEEQSEHEAEATQSEPSGGDTTPEGTSETQKHTGGINVGSEDIRNATDRDAVIVW